MRLARTKVLFYFRGLKRVVAWRQPRQKTKLWGAPAKGCGAARHRRHKLQGKKEARTRRSCGHSSGSSTHCGGLPGNARLGLVIQLLANAVYSNVNETLMPKPRAQGFSIDGHGAGPSQRLLWNPNTPVQTAILVCFVAVLSYFAPRLEGAFISAPPNDLADLAGLRTSSASAVAGSA